MEAFSKAVYEGLKTRYRAEMRDLIGAGNNPMVKQPQVVFMTCCGCNRGSKQVRGRGDAISRFWKKAPQKLK
jgi:hypothetical protein